MGRRRKDSALRRDEARSARRVDRWLSTLLRGHHPDAPLVETEERRAAAMAAHLHALAARDAEPTDTFAAGLLARLREERASATADALPVRRWMTRRNFAGVAFVAGAAVMAVAAFAREQWATGRRRTGPGSPAAGPRPGAPTGGWIQVGLAERFPPGTVASVMAGNAYVFIVGRAEGPLALSGRCTDVGCPLQFAQAQNQLECPCHGAEFSLDGVPVPGKYWAHLPNLAQLPLRVVDGQVEIQPPPT